MKMAAVAEAIGIGIGVAIALGSRLFRITIANPDPDSDTDCYGLSLFSEQPLMRWGVLTRMKRWNGPTALIFIFDFSWGVAPSWYDTAPLALILRIAIDAIS
jgi:hypothetical protein